MTRGLGALGGRRLEGAGELRPLALRLGERGEQRLDPLARLLRDRRGRGCRCGCGRRDDGGRGTRRRRRGRAAPLRRLDHADDLAERLDEGADVVLGDRPRRLRDEHEASQRGHAGVQRKTRDRAHRHPPARVALQSIVHTNERGARTTVPLTQCRNHAFGQASDLCDARGRILARPRTHLLFAERVPREEFLVFQSAIEDHVHHPERERGVRSRADREPFVALRSGARLDGIDRDHVRPLLPRA